MATIDKDLALVTLVNVFSVAPAKQQPLADLLLRATEETMQHLPGFVSAKLADFEPILCEVVDSIQNPAIAAAG